MKKIAIVTDSTADIEISLAQEMNILVVPLHVQLGNETYIDNITITRDEIYEQMQKGIIPKTSQPTPADFKAAYEKALQEAEYIIVICISNAVSGTLATARMTAQEMNIDTSRITFIDSKCTSAALGLMVMHAALLAEHGHSFEEVASEIQATVYRTRMYGTFDTLKYLLAGGRFGWGKAGETVGSLIPVKPVLYFKNGAVSLNGFCRTRKKAIDKICSLVRETYEKGNLVGRIGITYGTGKEEALQIQKYFDELTASTIETYVSQLGPTLSVHGGTSTLAISFEDLASENIDESTTEKRKGLHFPKIRLPFTKDKS